MAKKRSEFRPDQTGSGILAKLYLTQKQRLSFLKWVLYALVLLVASVAQDVVLSRVRLFGAATDLVPCLIFIVCVLEGSESGSVFCLAASLVYLFSGTAPGVYAVVFITFLGIAASIFRQSYLRKGFGATVLCVWGSLTVYELLIFLTGLFLGLTHPGRVLAFLLTAQLSALAVPVFYPILVSIGKIGGESWKE